MSFKPDCTVRLTLSHASESNSTWKFVFDSPAGGFLAGFFFDLQSVALCSTFPQLKHFPENDVFAFSSFASCCNGRLLFFLS
jgi:hypothetical protein